MRYSPILLAGLLTCGAAQAQDVKIKPSLDARLRYEHVEQEGLPRDADAVTLRVRPGIEASLAGWSALIEGEATLAVVDRYNDGTNGKTAYPLVVDPENVELNRAQIRYAGKHGLGATIGRQRLALGDERFVGPAAWRQNEQTFDAIRLQWGEALGLGADLTYAASVRTVNGRNGAGARPEAIDGDNVFALVGYGFKPGRLSGFAYLVDQDEAAVQAFRLSSQTWGVRFAGATPIATDVKLGYAASWARQSDYGRNPNRYSAEYWLGEASLMAKGLTGTLGYEVLGADRGVALTSVQTPLASYFRFNGWAGKFGTTPPNGLHDLYATLAHGWKRAGPIGAVTLSGTFHRFTSDRMGLHYGDELDLLASVRIERFLVSARFAHYRADQFATDTDKFWLQLDWSL